MAEQANPGVARLLASRVKEAAPVYLAQATCRAEDVAANPRTKEVAAAEVRSVALASKVVVDSEKKAPREAGPVAPGGLAAEAFQAGAADLADRRANRVRLGAVMDLEVAWKAPTENTALAPVADWEAPEAVAVRRQVASVVWQPLT